MEEFILSETTNVFNKAIKRFAKNDKKESQDVSLILKLDASGELQYVLCHDHKPNREITIKEIFNVKVVDTKGYTMILPPYIKKILQGLETSLNTKNVEVGVYQSRKEDDEDNIQYFVYNDGNFLKEVNLVDLIKL
jgi:hypothetical protein